MTSVRSMEKLVPKDTEAIVPADDKEQMNFSTIFEGDIVKLLSPKVVTTH